MVASEATNIIYNLSLVGCPTEGSVSCGLLDPVNLLWGKKFSVRTIVPDTTDGNLNVV